MHEHLLPMRWADLDSLNHVNNVVYLDYAAESRAVLVADGLLDASAPIASMTVVFRRPMLLGRTPVVVASTLDGTTLRQEIATDTDGGRVVFAEVTSEHGRPDDVERRADVPALPMRVRHSDLDAAGAVTPTKVFELFQESRVLHISTHLASMTPGSFVVGTSSVTLHAPIRWRLEPFDASVWVSRVGRASFQIRSDLSDGRTVLASSSTTLVGFDPSRQTSRAFGDDEREQLQTLRRD